MKSLLCVGGCVDGQRAKVSDEARIVKLMKPVKTPLLPMTPHKSVIIAPLETDDYIRVTLGGAETETFEILLHKDLSIGDALKMLMNGYVAGIRG